MHLWLEALASNEEVVKRYYHPWSFIGSPGWVQIKCELRLLSKFSFNLNPGALRAKPGSTNIIRPSLGKIEL